MRVLEAIFLVACSETTYFEISRQVDSDLKVAKSNKDFVGFCSLPISIVKKESEALLTVDDINRTHRGIL